MNILFKLAFILLLLSSSTDAGSEMSKAKEGPGLDVIFHCFATSFVLESRSFFKSIELFLALRVGVVVFSPFFNALFGSERWSRCFFSFFHCFIWLRDRSQPAILYIEPKMHNVSVLDNIIFSL